MKYKVVFIDDEPFLVKDFRTALAASFELKYFSKPDDGLAHLLSADGHGTHALVLDIMMPALERPVRLRHGDNEPDTGLAIMAELANRRELWPLGLVILTNKAATQLNPRLQEIPEYHQIRHLSEIRFKPSTSPDELVKVTKELAQKAAGNRSENA